MFYLYSLHNDYFSFGNHKSGEAVEITPLATGVIMNVNHILQIELQSRLQTEKLDFSSEKN